MIKNIYTWLFTFCVIFTISSCESFLDVNTDPNKTNDAALNTLMPTILYYSANNTFLASNVVSQYTQQIGAVVANGADAQTQNKFDGLWSNIYLNVIPNANEIIAKADENGSPYYSGIAKIVVAYNLGLATSIWENVPYSSADNNLSDFSPAYDSQEAIYEEIQNLLENAIADLGQTTSLFKPSTDDIVFKGNIANWLKTAYTLQARYLLHTSKKTGVVAYDAILNSLDKGIKANSEDFQLIYTDKNFNPWHAIALANNTGNLTTTFSAQFVNHMNGSIQGIVDPRLPLMAFKSSTDIYKGVNPGTGSGYNCSYNDKTNFYGFNFALLAPLQMVTNAEARFIEAEARFLKNGNQSNIEVQKAYIDGINASMTKMGVAATAASEFTSNTSVNPSADNLSLSNIMTEKCKANFLNPETWNDMRRYEYDATIWTGLSLPENHNPDLAGQWIQRGLYPDSETSRNSEVAAANFKALNAKMWLFN